MKAENTTTGHNRTIKITEIPGPYLNKLTITVNYVDGGCVVKARTLDSIIIPEIIKALNN
jgi:hypothetical protein